MLAKKRRKTSSNYVGAPCEAKTQVYTRPTTEFQIIEMFARLPKKLRVKTALFVAVLYALCVITPGLALAFTDSATAAQCLTDHHHAADGRHANGEAHLHHNKGASGDHEKQKSENCCGLFCVTAGTVPLSTQLGPPDHAHPIKSVLDGTLGGRPSDRIDRPPRSLLSL